MTEFLDSVSNVELNEDRFLGLLEKLIGESESLQNSPSQGLTPREDNASRHCIDLLTPHTVENGGPLVVERISFVEGRGNLIIKYPGTTDAVCSFVGSHLDVVPASRESWSRDPFRLTVDGDVLHGRGTTDCLGHVALLTDMMISLATLRPALKTTIYVVFIANEESGAVKGIGIDQLSREGYLEPLKKGPVFWIDASDRHPCVGTAGMCQWRMKTHGKLFHSGLPHKGINSIEMAFDAMNYIQDRFYTDFPRHPMDDNYNFVTASTMKPTHVRSADGSLNQLPPLCVISGDIRLSPFYKMVDAKKAVEGYVATINADPSGVLERNLHGPHSKYSIPEEDEKGQLDFEWIGEGEDGIACDMNSVGFIALAAATKEVLGEALHFSIGGSLPLVRSMQSEGFDIQIMGYGMSNSYHADDECAHLSHFKQATKIFCKIVRSLNR